MKYITGSITNHPMTDPASDIAAILGPTRNPAPSSDGYTSIPTAPPLRYPLSGISSSSGKRQNPLVRNLNTPPIPMPLNSIFEVVPPSFPATITSAHAVPSGYGSLPCSSFIRNFLIGIMSMHPSSPPSAAMVKIVIILTFTPISSSAGSVNATPAARASP